MLYGVKDKLQSLRTIDMDGKIPSLLGQFLMTFLIPKAHQNDCDYYCNFATQASKNYCLAVVKQSVDGSLLPISCISQLSSRIFRQQRAESLLALMDGRAAIN